MAIHCKSCGYDNDTTRVFCHNCGTKLERAAAPASSPVTVTRPSDVAKMKARRPPVPWGKYANTLLKLCLLAALAAVVAAAVLPPREVPPPVAPDENLAKRISGLLNDASSAAGPVSFDVPAADVQCWLVTVAKLAPGEGPVRMDPKRVYLAQRDGAFRVAVETSLLDAVDLHFAGEYAPVADGAGQSLRPLGYSIGRLPLPVALGWPVERQLAPLRDALSEPLAQLAKASRIGVAPDKVTLQWPGAAPR